MLVYGVKFMKHFVNKKGQYLGAFSGFDIYEEIEKTDEITKENKKTKKFIRNNLLDNVPKRAIEVVAPKSKNDIYNFEKNTWIEKTINEKETHEIKYGVTEKQLKSILKRLKNNV